MKLPLEIIKLQYFFFCGVVGIILTPMLNGCTVSDESGIQTPTHVANATPGAVTLHEPLSQTDVTFVVENPDGDALPGQVVRLVSDGERYDALTYDPTGAHVPALYFGTLREPTAEQAWQRFLAPRQAYAFSPFAVTMRVEAAEPGRVTFLPLSSTGHFQFAGLYDGSAVSVCARREAFAVATEVMEALATAQAGVLLTPDALTAWAFRELPWPSAVQSLAERLYEGFDPQTPHAVTILSSDDEHFKFLFATAENCEEPIVLAFTVSADPAAHETVCAPNGQDDATGGFSRGQNPCNDLSVSLITTAE